MNIEELKQKISVIVSSDKSGNEKRDDTLNLSIQFTIDTLEKCIDWHEIPWGYSPQDMVEDKIEELKGILNG